MVKNGKKMTEEEIEEHRNETYQMMAAMSGKPISELIGDEVHRGNYGEKDCLIKQMFLKNLVEPISSRQLFETLRKQGYDAKYTTFCGLLNRYGRYGYVEKKTSKKPFLFGLTDEGYQHAKNPYLAREELARKRMNFIFSEIERELVDHPEALKNLVETITQMNIGIQIGSGVTVVSNSGSQYSENDFSGRDAEIEEMRAKIEDDGFLQGVNEDKIKELIELGDPELLTDFCLNLNDYHRRHKTTMYIGNNPNNVPTGKTNDKKSMPNYFDLLFTIINREDTTIHEEDYKAIPYRFYESKATREIRLSGKSEAGNYKNNDDGNVLRV